MATHGAVMSEHFRAVNGGPGKPQATCTHCSQTVPPIGRDSMHRSVQYLLVGAHAALCNAVQPTPSEDFTALERRYGNPQEVTLGWLTITSVYNRSMQHVNEGIP